MNLNLSYDLLYSQIAHFTFTWTVQLLWDTPIFYLKNQLWD